eukprot:scaffold17651_cov118-Isochrysis_galbana.AAC.4
MGHSGFSVVDALWPSFFSGAGVGSGGKHWLRCDTRWAGACDAGPSDTDGNAGAAVISGCASPAFGSAGVFRSTIAGGIRAVATDSSDCRKPVFGAGSAVPRGGTEEVECAIFALRAAFAKVKGLLSHARVDRRVQRLGGGGWCAVTITLSMKHAGQGQRWPVRKHSERVRRDRLCRPLFSRPHIEGSSCGLGDTGTQGTSYTSHGRPCCPLSILPLTAAASSLYL